MKRTPRPELIAGKSFGKFTIKNLIGRGGFADIYRVASLKEGVDYAMKVELKNNEKTNHKKEKRIMEQFENTKYFPKLIQTGQTKTFNFIVMELVGPSLASIREIMPSGKLPLSTALRVGIEMLRCIEYLHRYGFIHRDIKPSNFLIRASKSCPLCLIDFGLSRQYINPSNAEIIPARKDNKFVGSVKYASINAHYGKDLGRRDDLISWFYSLVELTRGTLPYPHTKNRNEMLENKKECKMETELQGLPRQFFSLWRTIMMLKFESTPNYLLLISFLDEAMRENSCSWFDPFVWETIDARIIRKISSISLVPHFDESPNIPTDLPPPYVPGEEPKEAKNKSCCMIA